MGEIGHGAEHMRLSGNFLCVEGGTDHDGIHARAAGSLDPAQGILKDQATRRFDPQNPGRLQEDFRVRFAMLHILTTDHGLKVTAQVDGQDTKVSTEYQEGKSQWYTVAVTPGRHRLTLKIAPTKDSLSWQGKATAWFVSKQRQNTKVLEIALKQSPPERLLPPIVWQSGEVRKNLKLGEVKLSAAKLK